MTDMLTVKDIVRIIFKRKWIIICSLVLFLLVSYAYLNLTLPVYKAEVKILVSSAMKNISPTYAPLNVLRKAQPVVNQSEIVKSRMIIEPVVNSLRLYKREDRNEFYTPIRKKLQPVIDKIFEWLSNVAAFFIPDMENAEDGISSRIKVINKLRKKLYIKQVEDSDVFYVVVKDYSPYMAQKIANTIGKQYVMYDMEQQVANLLVRYGDKYPEVAQLKEQIVRIKDMLTSDSITDLTSLGLGTIRIVEPAILPVKPYWPKPLIVYSVAVISAFLFAGIIIIFLEVLNSTFQNPWEFECHTEIPVLGSIPYVKKTVRGHLIDNPNSGGRYASAYKSISDNVYMAVKKIGMKNILFVDIGNEVNSAVNTYNIGLFLSSAYNLNVLLVDADMRNKKLTRLLGLKRGKKGLSEFLAGDAFFNEIVYENKSLNVVPSGLLKHNPLILLMGDGMKKFLDKAGSEYDIVLINTPPVSKYRDSVVMLDIVSHFIVSLSEGEEKREITKRVFDMIPGYKDKVIGAIFNDRTSPIPASIYKRL